MWSLNYENVTQISSVLGSSSLAMSKKFGQNFLLPASVRNRIVDLVDLPPEGEVWEIGPGIGALTGIMLSRGAAVRAFEIDHGFCRILGTEAFPDEGAFTLVEGDALKTLFLQEGRPERICGNLPYNVGSVLIARLVENSLLPERMVFTLQKEVVERMCAHSGDDAYSSFSVLTQLDYENRMAFTIGRGNFYPVPNVDSAVVLMIRRKQPLVDPGLRPLFLETVRKLFSQRRKTIRNNLSGLGRARLDEVFRLCCLTGGERAEVLSFEKLRELAAAIRQTEGL